MERALKVARIAPPGRPHRSLRSRTLLVLPTLAPPSPTTEQSETSPIAEEGRGESAPMRPLPIPVARSLPFLQARTRCRDQAGLGLRRRYVRCFVLALSPCLPPTCSVSPAVYFQLMLAASRMAAYLLRRLLASTAVRGRSSQNRSGRPKPPSPLYYHD